MEQSEQPGKNAECQRQSQVSADAGTDGMTDAEKEALTGLEKHKADFIEKMEDDLNTSWRNHRSIWTRNSNQYSD